MTEAKGETSSAAADPSAGAAYQVLARKYRPAKLSELVGQEILVRTLTNAFASGRLAHAFMLVGVRGVGKTTTARIIARALNCVGPDGTGGPNPEPCGVCEHCTSIAKDRHVDVIEMDAASSTGIDDIRELIDGVRYRPLTARNKIYIIDEIHMLSKQAFNALLKTLEEPPENVTFIFATTEARKVPVTVLSRCQRYDLRRVDQDTLAAYLVDIAGREGAEIAAGAVALIARAADGSVRDALSLLDQILAHGTGEADAAAVRDMLGLADRGQIIDLFDRLMAGDAEQALGLLGAMYKAGAEPVVVAEDLLDLCHWLTRLRLVPEAAEGAAVSEAERARAGEIAGRLSMAVLGRAWQMLLKGMGEVQAAPAPLAALEMVLVRLAYAAELPTPAEIVAALQDGADTAPAGADETPAAKATKATEADSPATTPPKTQATPTTSMAPTGAGQPQAALAVEPVRAEAPAPAPAPALETASMPATFEELVALFAEHREALLHAQLLGQVHLVRFEAGRLEFRPDESAPANLANRVGELLSQWTGERWLVSVSGEAGEPTLDERVAEADRARKQAAAGEPLVRAALDAFPGAVIEEVREHKSKDDPADGDGEAS